MNAPERSLLSADETLHQAIESAIDSVAPNWPLDRMIAVNPYWGRIHRPFGEVAVALSRIAGSPLTPPLAEFGEAWRRGEIIEADLERALAESSAKHSVASLIAALDTELPPPVPLPLLSDLLDRQRDLSREPAWCDSITHQVSQFCASFFDRDQADWHPERSVRLYRSWRDGLGADHSIPLLMRVPDIPARARQLCVDPEQQIAESLARLAIPRHAWRTYLQAVLMRVSGWAGWCAYLRWQARLEGGDDRSLRDLLAIRLAWETLLDDGARGEGSLWAAWKAEWQRQDARLDYDAVQIVQLWQRAREASYQRGLHDRLRAAPAQLATGQATVQAAFCIDVRSEVLRRHLEHQSDAIQTIGFAGFFGLPLSYAPLGTGASRPQLPGLLAPAVHITDSTGTPALDEEIASRRSGKLRSRQGWRIFQSVPLSTFTLVEALGLGYLAKLVKRSLPGGAPFAADDRLGLDTGTARTLRPTLDAKATGGVAGQADLAAQALAGMGLTDHFARLVLLVGHGSQNRNNPQRAGLDCGACCGQTGEVNARTLAGLLNDQPVRRALQERGIQIPDSTRFVAGLHNTTSDEVELFDIDQLPAGHAGDIERLQRQLASAGDAARAERAPSLGLGALAGKPGSLHRALRQRADDWAETRPEWGLANNASFIVAPRARTRGLDLQGRSFLHDYDYRKDPDGSLLELIMTAPMVVTHWINMQYYASTVDNRRYGSGNKTLHNVVAGRLGVFEGNGGDLRIGLPLQSLHDGERWMHTPLRLTVVIEAPREAIDAVLEHHETVKQLVHNHWLHLMRLDGEQVEMRCHDGWQPWPA